METGCGTLWKLVLPVTATVLAVVALTQYTCLSQEETSLRGDREYLTSLQNSLKWSMFTFRDKQGHNGLTCLKVKHKALQIFHY